ncbi:protein rds1 [Linnemannia elongata]|nr:protein rds1 [Linnemannia elongata]
MPSILILAFIAIFSFLSLASTAPAGVNHTPIPPEAPNRSIHEISIKGRITAPFPVNKGYKSDGKLHHLPPKPHTPAGGLALNEIPNYHPLSDFDFQSLNLAQYTEWIELDLFRYALDKFSLKDFEEAGLTKADRALVAYMAEQEVGHATNVYNMLGPAAAKPCQYKYPFKTVREFITFSKQLTRVGEAGVLGFIEHLNSRPSAQLLLQTVTVEARQQMVFRQFEGLFPMPVWFQTAITQSMQWSLQARYIVSCPAINHKYPLIWQVFPELRITNNPNSTDPHFGPAISTLRTALSHSGREVKFEFDAPGKKVGPDGKYTTSTNAGAPKYAAWISQLNVTYTPLEDVKAAESNGDKVGRTTTKQPDVPDIYPGLTTRGHHVINGTVFVALVDDNVYVTPANLSELNAHVVAGPALYQAG